MFFKKKKKEVEIKSGNPTKEVLRVYIHEDPFVKIAINENIVSAFNRLVYAYDINKQFSKDVFALGSATEIILRRTAVDYFIYILRKNNEGLISDEEKNELNAIFQNAIADVPAAGTRTARIEQN